MLGATVEYLVAMANLRSGFGHPCGTYDNYGEVL
jgi:hypothetical protein